MTSGPPRAWPIVVAALGCAGPPEAPPEPAARNLLMIAIDTLRRDHVSRYDPAGRDLTPFLDARMAEGVVADRHRSCSNWTFPAVACALSGRPEVELGQVPRLLGLVERWDDGITFLPDALEAAGFETTFTSGNGYLLPELGLTEPYDRATFVDHGVAQALIDASLPDHAAALAAHPEARWAWHLHLMEPHTPYAPPAAYREGEAALDPVPYDLDATEGHYTATEDLWPAMTPDEQALLAAHLAVRYEGEVRWLDDQLRALWTELDGRGWLDDTLVVVWSDHGEQFWEHGHQAHGYQLLPEENDAIFFTWTRGGAPDAVSLPTSHVDVLPTTLAGLGLAVPPEVAGLPLAEVRADRPTFAATRGRAGTMQAVDRHQKRLVVHWSGQASWFDLAADPGATVDRFDPSDPEVQAAWALLAPVVRAADALVADESAVPVPGLP